MPGDSRRRRVIMPSSPWPLWGLAGLLIVGFPVLNFVYWPEVLRSGVLPPESDGIGIPMFGSILLAMLAAPVLLALSWACLRRYNPAADIAAHLRGRPWRSAAATLGFGGLALLLVAEIVLAAGRVQPWYEYLWPAYSALWVPWLIGLGAALVTQR